jgi:hypothetical protein
MPSLCLIPVLPVSYHPETDRFTLGDGQSLPLLHYIATTINKDFLLLSKYFHLSVPDHSAWSSEKPNNFFCQWIWFSGRYWCIWEYNLAEERDNLKPQAALNTLLLTKRKQLNWVGEKPCWMINCQTLCSSWSFSPFIPAAFLWILEERTLKRKASQSRFEWLHLLPKVAWVLRNMAGKFTVHMKGLESFCCSALFLMHHPKGCQYFYAFRILVLEISPDQEDSCQSGSSFWLNLASF